MSKEDRVDQVWLTLWGIAIALFIQVVYDFFGVFGTIVQLAIGLGGTAILFMGLLYWTDLRKKKTILPPNTPPTINEVEDEEREFAKIQTDVQIWQTGCFTFIVLLATLGLGAWQIISTPISNLPLDLQSLRDPIFYLISFGAIVSGVGTFYSLFKMWESRKKMDKPKKQYAKTNNEKIK